VNLVNVIAFINIVIALTAVVEKLEAKEKE
jgi:hypothetical protein